MTAQTPRTPRLGRVAVEILESIYQHRLLSTRQIHALHTPQTTRRWTQRLLARLQQTGLVASTFLPGRLCLWYVTEHGAEAVETVPNRAETRRKLIRPEQAAGPLQQHTLAVNQVGVAFVQTAREHGDLCGPFSWRHEIAHPLGPPPGRRTPEQLIPDALLTYERNETDGRVSFHYRFIELDRSTMPVDDLATKLARYARLYHHTPTPTPTGPLDEPEPLWTQLYPVFPAVLLVLAGGFTAQLERRRDTVLALCAHDPDLTDAPQVEIFCCLLADLTKHGPFAPIFICPRQPHHPLGWLQTPTERTPNGER